MPKPSNPDSIQQKAIAAGLKPATVYNRINKGMSVEDALSMPARKYKPLNPKKKSDLVWAYVLDNKLATPAEVAKATGVSYGYVHRLMSKVGTPREIFEREEAMRQIDEAWDTVSSAHRAARNNDATRISTVFLAIVAFCAVVGVVSFLWH